MPLEASTYRPNVVAAARQVYGDGKDVSEFDVSLAVGAVHDGIMAQAPTLLVEMERAEWDRVNCSDHFE